MRANTCLLSLLMACLLGCAGAQHAPRLNPPAGVSAGTASDDVLTGEEILAWERRDALAAIEFLRPRFLARRGGMDQPVVYIDDVRQTGIADLAAIPSVLIREIRFLRSFDATTRFGTGHTAGAILVSTIRRVRTDWR